MAGITMWLGGFPRNCTMRSPRSVSTTSIPFFSRKGFRWHSSVRIDLLLTSRRTLCARRMLSTWRLCSSASTAHNTFTPFAVAAFSNCSRYLSRFANTSSLIADAALRKSSQSGTVRIAASRFSRTNQSVSSCHFDRGRSARNSVAPAACDFIRSFLHPERRCDKPAHCANEHERLVLTHTHHLRKYKKRRHDGHRQEDEG